MSQRTRRTQQERSARTRNHILETTFECLEQVGYARTTTVEVCKRGQISRGALLHHYPSKETLVIASIKYVFDKRLDEFKSRFAEIPAVGNRRHHAIDVLWDIFSGPTFYVWLELLVAEFIDMGSKFDALGPPRAPRRQSLQRLLEEVSPAVVPDEVQGVEALNVEGFGVVGLEDQEQAVEALFLQVLGSL